MRWLPLLYFGVSAIFHECYAFMPDMLGGGVQQNNMLKFKHEIFQSKYPGQTCELIPNIGLPYPEYHAGDSHYATKLISLNSYICADTKFAEPYYKTEAVHLYDEIDYHIFVRRREPGVERSIGFQDNGFIMGLAKYYDTKKKPFNIYTGNYLRSLKGHGTVKPSKPMHKKKPRVSSDSNPQAKNNVPILNAKVTHKRVTDSGRSETVEEPNSDSSSSTDDVKRVAQKAKDHDTGNYLRSLKGHGTVKPSKPKHKKKPRVSSDSNPQAKKNVPILNANVVRNSGGSETIEEPNRDSSEEVAQKAKDRKSKLDKGKSRKEIAKDEKSREEDLEEKGENIKDVENEGKKKKKKRKRRHHRND
ncbi:uncharacterized protein LOC111050401 [Nilaparvata lugens]|uniref:uncharacterized protein LOC111050401 n=1 Tax=Nilaparvata lugens TaxID=108931 RepID=UPI00193E5F94|nr:uncharacterized protein LOC111050401 [Nilaparvata lugens]